MRARWLLLLLPVLLGAAPQAGLREWAGEVGKGLGASVELAKQGDLEGARREITRVYLDYYEVIEGWYGPGGAHAQSAYEREVADLELEFHALLRAGSAGEIERRAPKLARAIAGLVDHIAQRGASLYPSTAVAPAAAGVGVRSFSTPELAPWQAEFEAAHRDLAKRAYGSALKRVERIYLEGFEPLESRLPSDLVNEIEKTIHLQLRPALKAESPHASASLAALGAQLSAADQFLAQGGSFWFGAFNALAIIVREGLEAVLLIGALLAYLSATRAAPQDRRRIWIGAAAGVVASLLTWLLARTLIPVNGASRELIEGVTALIAVGVLLYVSHWLFQKTYIHDWKEYLRDHLGTAIGRGSAFAMMSLSFAAVYREGFETVLFYQALAFDVGARAVLSGFIPGAIIIALVGWGIIRAGVKLPLKRVFTVTNSILLYLAFVFLGKGVFNLQESGAFSAHPIPWLPSHPALQQLFGFYPLMETILAQLVLAALLASVFVVYKRKVKSSRTDTPRAALAA